MVDVGQALGGDQEGLLRRIGRGVGIQARRRSVRQTRALCALNIRSRRARSAGARGATTRAAPSAIGCAVASPAFTSASLVMSRFFMRLPASTDHGNRTPTPTSPTRVTEATR